MLLDDEYLKHFNISTKRSRLKMNSKILKVIFFMTLSRIQAKDYCDPSLCSNGEHIGCKHSGKFAKSCPADAQIIDLSAHKDLILHEHNSKRNELAGGQISRMAPAVRMATMVWDSELANLAQLNVRQCKMNHDKCHNTEMYKNSGQNLGYTFSSAPLGETSVLLKNLINSWWNEKRHVQQCHMDKYPRRTKYVFGHFTVMSVDHNSAVGCGAARFKNKAYNFLVACNYGATNIIGKSIYKKGSTGSKCSNGMNKQYANLCSETNKPTASVKPATSVKPTTSRNPTVKPGSGKQEDYCDPSICYEGIHIACHHSGQFAKSCPSNAEIVDLSPLTALILDEHNKRRDQLAGGNLNGFKPAARMATMIWDGDLAKFAVLNVLQCAMEHDHCHSTKKYFYAGQNLAIYSSSAPLTDIRLIVAQRIERWWIEHKYVKQSEMDSYPATTAQQIGHFTAMSIDYNVAVGCGASKYSNGMHTLLLACNYAETNVVRRPIYISGPSGSQCKKGRSTKYSNLCNVNENYA